MKAWRSELLRAGVPILAGAGVGYAFGVMGWGAAAGAAAALAWVLRDLAILARRRGAGLRGSRVTGMAREIESAWIRDRRREADRRAQLVRLRRELVRLRRAVPDGALVIDAEGAIRWANGAACRWFGLNLPHDVGRPLVQLVRDPKLIERLERGRGAAEVELVSPARPQIELLVQIVPYGEGATLLLARDISRLKRLERMRRDFVANVSHELRSPLTVVSGYLEMIGEEPETPAVWKAPLAEMRRQVARMVAIVRDLLELARLESDATPPPRVPVAMPALIERVRSQIAAGGIGSRRIELHLTSSAEVLGAETELESAVGNLVSNAVKYTADDGHIEVTWRDCQAGAELQVADDGIGIPEREIPRLTERFYRVDKARSTRLGGTGLGLAIVKHVAERHGAHLRVESEVGVGSRFVLDFPATRTRRAVEKGTRPAADLPT